MCTPHWGSSSQKHGTTGLRLIVLLAVSTLVGGCVPWRYSGYMPHGAGILEGGYCVAGIRDRIQMRGPHGMVVAMYANKDQSTETLLLEVSLTIPRGVYVRLLSTGLTLQSAAWPAPRMLAIDRITGGAAGIHEPLAVLRGSSNQSHSAFTLWFTRGDKGTLWQTGITAVPHFAVLLPPLKINGQRFEFRPVTFEAYRKWGIYTCAQ